MLPGLGTKEDIKEAQGNGGSICRIATHCTEADVSIQHFGLARELGLETVGFLMMSHTVSPEKLAAQARIMADAGCQCVYVVDSAGALVLEGVADRVAALVAELGDDAQVGFHGHENLGLGVANSVEAVRAGAKQIDGSCRRFGAGAGNAPVEALIGVFDKIGVKTGIDFFEIADAAEEVVAPAMPAECLLDRNALIMGYSGVYSSFLKHAIRQAERYGVPAHLLLHRAGQRKLIGGQEDQLIDIALEIKREQDAATAFLNACVIRIDAKRSVRCLVEGRRWRWIFPLRRPARTHRHAPEVADAGGHIGMTESCADAPQFRTPPTTLINQCPARRVPPVAGR